MIQEQSSLRDLLFFRQIMAACKNSANPNGPVTRSRIKPSFFICYTLERLWPLPQPKRLRCDIVHGHLGGRRGPTAGVCPESGAFSSICLAIWVFSFTEYIWSLSGSALRALNLVITLYHSIFFQFIRFSRGLQDWGQRSISNFSSSKWAFCGDEPHKICSQIFFNFWKKF